MCNYTEVPMFVHNNTAPPKSAQTDDRAIQKGNFVIVIWKDPDFVGIEDPVLSWKELRAGTEDPVLTWN